MTVGEGYTRSRYITNPNRWVIITEQYSGLIGRGVDLLNKTVSDFYRDYLSVYTMDAVEDAVLDSCNLILVGRNESRLITYLIFSFYSMICITQGFFRVRRLYAEQTAKKSRKDTVGAER